MDDPRQPAGDPGLSAASPPVDAQVPTIADSPFPPLQLVLRPGGTTIEVSRPDMLIGRHSDCDIRLSLPDVSRRHCRLVLADGRWQIFDLNSLNGLYLNGSQVLQAPLNHGDMVRLGGLTFEVTLPQAEAVREDTAPTCDLPPRADILRTIAKRLPLPGQELPQRKAS